MRYLILLFPVLLNAQAIQLAPPQFIGGPVFFITKSKVSLEFDLDNSAIHYAFNDTLTQHSPVYNKPVKIRNSGTLKVMATHPDFLPSEVLEKQFVKVRYQPKNLKLLTPPNEKYPGKGAASLHDLKKGARDLHDGAWLGFLSDTIAMEVLFVDKKLCNSLIISTLIDKGAWVFPPRKIVVYAKNKQSAWEQIGLWQAENTSTSNAPGPNYAEFISLELQPMKTREIRIEVLPWGLLPLGHPGAGTPAWLFLDEIVFQ